MRLLLVRHGQSANNAAFAAYRAAAGETPSRRHGVDLAGYPDRVPDPTLTALGERQAEALAATLASGRLPLRPTHLYVSRPLRAVRTARPLADALGLPVLLRPDLHEVGGLHRHDAATDTRHPVAGPSVNELIEHCPRLVPAPGTPADPDRPWDGGFERLDDVPARARGLLSALRAAHDDGDTVVLVTHQYFAQFVLADLLGLSGPPWRRFRVDNTAHVLIDLTGPSAVVDWLNRSDHLTPREVTN